MGPLGDMSALELLKSIREEARAQNALIDRLTQNAVDSHVMVDEVEMTFLRAYAISVSLRATVAETKLQRIADASAKAAGAGDQGAFDVWNAVHAELS